MQFSYALVALVVAGLANVQIPDVPACSLNCFVSALTSDGCSALTDFACHCQKPQLITDITPCVEKACEASDRASVSKVVVSQCSAAGHPISVPPVETGSPSSGSSAAGSSSAPVETSASTTAVPTESSSAGQSSSAAASSSGSVPSKPTGASPSSSSPHGSGSGSGSTPAGTSTPLPSKTNASGSASTSPIYTGAATNVKGNMAGVAAVAAAAAYML